MHRDGSPSELDDAREDAEDRRQLFVQQVAEALVPLLSQWDHKGGHTDLVLASWANIEDLAADLAPRVTATIAAAAKLYADAIDGEWGAGQGPGSYDYERATDEIHAVALSALRGETP